MSTGPQHSGFLPQSHDGSWLTLLRLASLLCLTAWLLAPSNANATSLYGACEKIPPHDVAWGGTVVFDIDACKQFFNSFKFGWIDIPPQYGTASCDKRRETCTYKHGGKAGTYDYFQTYDDTGTRFILEVRIVPPAPTAGPVSVSLAYNAAATNIPIDNIPIDIGSGIPTSVAIDRTPTHGTATVDGTRISYRPDSGFAGQDSFTYTASNDGGTSDPAIVTVTVGDPTVTLSPTALPEGVTGSAYSATFSASGGNAPYHYAVSSGTLPDGLSLDATSGKLSGNPTRQGSFDFGVIATDSSSGGRTFSANQSYRISIKPPAPTTGPVSVSLAYNAAATNVPLDIGGGASESVALGSTPTHGTATVDGTRISYRPDSGFAGEDSFTYTATNRGGSSAPAIITVTVGDPTVTLSPAALPEGVTGSAYSATFSASGGNAPYRYVVSSGTLPDGLSLDATSGKLSGTPSAQGSFDFGVTATDSSSGGRSFSANQSYRISIKPPAPTAGPVSVSLAYNAAATNVPLDIGGGASESVALGSAPTHGTATVDGTHISYRPDSGFAGEDSFTYTASNDGGSSAPAIVTVTVGDPTVALSPTALPEGITGSTYSTNFIASGGTAPYHYAVSSGTLPDGLSLNATSGKLSGNPTRQGSFDFGVTATDSSSGGRSFSASQSYRISIKPPAPTASPVSVSLAYNAAATNVPLDIGGGTPTSVAIDRTPTHGTATVDGTRISYRPDSGFAGEDSFTYTATNRGGSSAPAIVTVTVGDPAVTLSPTALPEGVTGSAYSATFSASGGNAPYRYAVSTGALPSGLSLDATSGKLSGTPSAQGSFSFTVTATDSSSGGRTFSASQAYTVKVTPALAPPQARPVSLTVAYNAAANNVPLDIGGGASESVALGSAPTHGTATVDGTRISYRPDSGFAGEDSFTYTATNRGGSSAPAIVTVTVGDPTVTLSPTALPEGVTGSTYSATFSASGGTAPYRYAVSTGTLPSGISLDSASGRMHGTPSTAGSTHFTVTATDRHNSRATQAYRLTIKAAPSITLSLSPDSLPAAIIDTPYHQAITANGGTAPYRFTLIDSTLPGGLTLSEEGILGGTPETAGHFAFSIAATDNLGFTGKRDYVLAISPHLDPSRDAEVRGLVEATVDASLRFSAAQFTNFHERLTSLHRRGARARIDNQLHFTAQPTLCRPPSPGRPQSACSQVPIKAPWSGYSDPIASPLDPTPRPAQAQNLPHDWAVWIGGNVRFGSDDGESRDTEQIFTTDGLSMGADLRVSEAWDVGAGLGWAQDRSEVGSHGSRSEGEAQALALYSSYHPDGLWFVDTLIGHEPLSFDLQRHVTDTNTQVRGHRNGHQWFSSLTLGADILFGDRWLATPYARGEVLRTQLHAYRENGDPRYTLHHEPLNINTSMAHLGLRLDHRHETRQGVVAHWLQLEHQYHRQSSGHVNINYADQPWSPYRYTLNSSRHRRISVGVGQRVEWSNGLGLGLEYQGAFGDGHEHGLLLNLSKSL